MLNRLLPAGLLLLVFVACNKNNPIDPGPEPLVYRVHFNNEYQVLQARFAVFLSDDLGQTRAFRWLPGNDTASVWISGIDEGQTFDCTIARITIFETPGTSGADTTVSLTTYPHLGNERHIRLRDDNFMQRSDLQLSLTNLNTLDSIIVAEGLPFAQPSQANGYEGLYSVFHTGTIGLRMQIDGDPHWRYMVFNNVSGSTVNASIDVKNLPVIFNPSKFMQLPFLASWSYHVDGVIDTAARRFMGLGDRLYAPGGFVPTFNSVEVVEPIDRPYTGYRIRLDGSEAVAGGYRYLLDRFYAEVPTSFPAPSFDLNATLPSNSRSLAVQNTGIFDALSMTRINNAQPHLQWEVYTRPEFGGVQSYTLPDVPRELGDIFSGLASYNFLNLVRCRAESYEKLDFDAAFEQKLLNNDPLWQAKAGYLAREESF